MTTTEKWYEMVLHTFILLDTLKRLFLKKMVVNRDALIFYITKTAAPSPSYYNIILYITVRFYIRLSVIFQRWS